MGEYSNVHWTLAEGLRRLGHEVTVVSDGDRWKGYRRDVDLRRRSLGARATARYALDIARLLPRLRGYDVVQLINPVFLDIRAERIRPVYSYLRRHNGLMVLGAFGIDQEWVRQGLKAGTFRYSDFYANGQARHTPEVDTMVRDWGEGGAKARLGDHIAADCDAIVSGLYEYDVCYRHTYAAKLTFIPFPIDHAAVTPRQRQAGSLPVRAFIGIQESRSAYKGTDIMLRALHIVRERHPRELEAVEARSVPFATYEGMMNSSDLLLDQLYSYTPAMNALLAMAKGLVVVGGGEEEQYDILDERELRPIINVRPSLDDVVDRLEEAVTHPGRLARMSAESMAYTRRHHDHLKVALQYADLYGRLARS